MQTLTVKLSFANQYFTMGIWRFSYLLESACVFIYKTTRLQETVLKT